MNARSLASRVARIEKSIPPPQPGCDACRGRFVLGREDFTASQEGGRTVYRCASCSREFTEGIRLIGMDLREVL